MPDFNAVESNDKLTYGLLDPLQKCENKERLLGDCFGLGAL